MTSARIVVFAYSELGHACLEYLTSQGEKIVAVYTHEDNPLEKIWFESVAKQASKNKIPVFTAESLKSEIEQTRIQELKPDLLFSFYYRNLIPSEILKLPRLGSYNMHGSYLPQYRGRAPANWAVLNGETQTGVTLHVMVEKADAGDIVDQEAVTIGSDDTAAQVQERITKAAVQVLQRQLQNLKSGTAPHHPQDHSKATVFGRRKPEDGLIDWKWSAQKIHNLVRAVTHPYPGAFAKIGGIKTIVWKTNRVTDPNIKLAPGELYFDGRRLFVGCGENSLIEISRAQRDGEEETAGAELARRVLTKMEKRGIS